MSKRTIGRSFALLFVVLGLGAYGVYLLSGRLPQLPSAGRAPGAGQPELSTLAPMRARDEGGYQVMQGGDTTVYKWRDAAGRWHYGSRAPTDARQPVAVPIDPAPAAVAATASAVAVSAAASPAAVAQPAASAANPYTAEGVRQLMERAEAVRHIMNERNAQLQRSE